MTRTGNPATPDPEMSANSAWIGSENESSLVRHPVRGELDPSPLRRRAWTPKEVSEQLGIPYETVLDLIHANRIGATKAGRYYLIPDFEVERFLDCARKAA